MRSAGPWSLLAPLGLELAAISVVVSGIFAGDALGVPIGAVVSTIVSVALTLSAVVMLAEVIASRAPNAPAPPAGPLPPVTAIVAAYLPNEQRTIVDTVEHLLHLPYGGHLQVICAYNTPMSLPVEQVLRELAADHPRLTVLPVAASTSKAANVNAALAVATGEIIGIFDADHHPDGGGFERAWAWLAAGHDVVQGCCRVRNGHRSRLARIVAAEFDGMYRVTHPGRARTQGFAIFGGSNGYWRADVLRATLLDPDMLTEDIDASVRSLAGGARLVSDPAIVSSELATDTVRALWQQRMRWAQGWSQVSRRHLRSVLASPHVGPRARAGLAWQFGWCELLPWVATLGIGVLVHDALVTELRWTASTAALAAFNVTVGPVHALAARARTPRHERHPTTWYLAYAIVSAVLYVEVLNLAKRTGHLRELGGRRCWVVTPRPRPERVAEPVPA